MHIKILLSVVLTVTFAEFTIAQEVENPFAVEQQVEEEKPTLAELAVESENDAKAARLRADESARELKEVESIVRILDGSLPADQYDWTVVDDIEAAYTANGCDSEEASIVLAGDGQLDLDAMLRDAEICREISAEQLRRITLEAAAVTEIANRINQVADRIAEDSE